MIAPDWPYDDRPPAELRASPRPELAQLGQREILDHYERIIRDAREPPIIIGHSAGGTFTQHLLDRGLGAAGVAIDPAPTPGVPLYPHAIVSALPVFIDPLSWRKAKVMSRKFFANRFAQTAPRDQVDALYDRYIVPTPGKVYWDGVINKIAIRLGQSGARAVAADRRRQGPDRRRGHDRSDLQEAIAGAVTDRAQDFPGSVTLDVHGYGLGGSRRLRARLGRAERARQRATGS